MLSSDKCAHGVAHPQQPPPGKGATTCAALQAKRTFESVQGGGEYAIRIFPHFPHFFPHFLGRSLSVMFKRKHSGGIVL